MTTRIFNTLLIIVLACGMAGVLYAQVDTSKGSMAVEVQDSSGAVVVGANVTLTSATGEQKGSTNERGEAVFRGLIPGSYMVKVENQGFRVYQAQNVVVRANGRSTVSAVLEPGAVTEVVQVAGTAITVDTNSTTTGASLTSDTYTNLPLGRNVTSLFALSAGVAPSGDPTLGAANPSISGSTGLENQYVIDGINTTDVGYGAFGVFSNVYGSMGTGVNFDFVKEVQVKTGGFEAQYGQALGGIVNVVTASGGNDIHGAVYAYFNPGFAEAKYKQVNTDFDAPRISTPMTEIYGRSGWDIGFNLGGPLIKNRFFWYGAFNPSFATTQRLAPTGFAVRDFGVQEWKRRMFNWVGKINYNITDNHRIEATAFGDPSRDPAGVHRSLLRENLDSESKNEYGTRNWATKYNGIFGMNTLVNASFAWNHTYFYEIPTLNTYSVRNYTKPTSSSSYTMEGGVGFMENNEGDNKQWSAMLTRNFTALGGHTVDIGYALNNIKYDAVRLYSGANWAIPAAKGVASDDVGKMVYGGYFYLYPTRTVGGVTYSNVYRQYRGNFSDPAVGTETDYHNGFIQDAWQVNRFLTVKAGVRWEQQNLSGNLSKYVFAANWAPRIGFIIDPLGNRKTKIFANWGRFFEKIPQDVAVRAMSEESGYLNFYSTALPPTASNILPGMTASPTGTEPTIIAGGTKAMYQEEIVLGAEHEFAGGVVLGARFIHRNLKRMLEDISGVTVEAYNAGIAQQYVVSNPSMSLDIFHNPVACTSGDNCDTETGFTYDSAMLGADGVLDGFPDPRRVYKAFELTAEKRFGSNWSLMANYRLAKLFGDYEGLFRNDNGQADPNITSTFDFIWSEALADQFKVGVLPTDRRHIANLYGNYLFRGKLNIGMGWQVMSGTPISKLLAHPGYLNAGEVPEGGRGAYGRTPTQNYFDFRLDYQIPICDKYKLKLGSNLYNAFNRKSIVDVDQDYESGADLINDDFLKPLRTHRPFYAAFSVRLEF